MATVPNTIEAKTRLDQFVQLPGQKKLGLMLATAAIIALLAGAWMWSQTPDYRVLYSNISDDQDGGAVISALQQMNIPYKFAHGGGAILVPGNQVHEVRLQLASQGLPKGGLAGFEVMENQKFGSSQFLEQINYQRALEGELARSVQSIAAVDSARVHLAMPKPTVFVRKKQQPRASVLLNLYPGRVMSANQVSAVVHLVSSSVSNLPVENVTVVDQNGNLLSTQIDKKSETGLDTEQIQYLRVLEEGYAKRIEAILSPITGTNNVRAQVTANLDFSRIERAEEIYRPNNSETDPASIRSQQNFESSSTSSDVDGGVPGALTNRPPEPAIAPIDLPEGEREGDINIKPAAKPTEKREESTINYEVDKTVQHTQQPTGVINRLSAAVVVNYRASVDEEGVVTHEPLSEKEISDINNLVKEAIGYSEARGDTLAVTNSLFSVQASTETPLWMDPDMHMLAKDIGKQLLIAVIVLFFLLKVLRPFLRNLTTLTEPVPALAENTSAENTPTEGETATTLGQPQNEPASKIAYQQNLEKAKQLAIDEPVIVASIVKEWVSGNG